jgi:hypothetical protein
MDGEARAKRVHQRWAEFRFSLIGLQEVRRASECPSGSSLAAAREHLPADHSLRSGRASCRMEAADVYAYPLHAE